MNVSKSDGVVAVGVLLVMYGGGMIHSSIPPLVFGLGLVYFGAFRMGTTEVATTPDEEE